MKKINVYYLMLFLLIISMFFFSVGYAAIANVDLGVNGTTSMNGQEGIIISGVTLYQKDANSSQWINTYYQTMLDTSIVLDYDLNSYVTYRVTITNQTDTKKQFDGVVTDPSFYSNNDIVYVLSGLSVGEEVAIGDSVTFDVTFRFDSNLTEITGRSLNSIINFAFSDVLEPEGHFTYDDLDVHFDLVSCYGNITCQYNLSMTNTSTEHDIKDWRVELPLDIASNCSIAGSWNATFQLTANSLVITTNGPNQNVIPRSVEGQQYTPVTAGVQITCPEQPIFTTAQLSYNVVGSGEGGGETGEGGETGGTSEHSTTTTNDNLTVHFQRNNYWTDGDAYMAQYVVTVENNTEDNFTYWSFNLTLPDGMTLQENSLVNCNATNNNGVYTITPVGWNQTIPFEPPNNYREIQITFRTDDLNKMVTIS